MVQTADFSTLAGYHYAFIEAKTPAALRHIATLMQAEPLNQTIVASTYVSGKPTLITRGSTAPGMIRNALAEHGEALEKIVPRKSLDPWKIRSLFGFGGQTLQLTSSFLRAGLAHKAGKGFWKNVDPSIFVFATANLAANVINLVYHDGEQADDIHQQRYLKQRINRDLAPHLSEGATPLEVDDNRKALRPSHESHKPMDEAKGFLKRHSVRVGELGLRYLGAIGLAYPATGWKVAFQNKTMPARNESGFRVYTGLSSIFGKTVALTSAIPDPYNPKPATWLDHIREKASFFVGGLIEITSFSALGYDCFFNSKGKKTGFLINGKHHHDWLGGIGASMFVLGYIARSWAKFGERNVDMGELYAHASDTLAATPPEKMPQLLANTAASLSEHFQDKAGLNFATIYTNLASDLSKFHALKKPVKSMNDNKKEMPPMVASIARPPTPSRPVPHITAQGAHIEQFQPPKAPAIR
jgi:hypothetical protein